MPQSKFQENRASNQLHTWLLMLAMTALLSLSGYALMGTWGLVAAIGLLVFGVFFTKRASAALVLRLYKAQPIQPHQAPGLVQMFDELCRRAELDSQPTLHYIPTRLPNAFACGTGNKTAVAITDGLLRILNARELAGVLAHEVAHIMNDDLRVMGTADSISRTTSMLSRFGVMLILFSFSGSMFGSGSLQMILAGLLLFMAPTGMILLQLAVSRTREFNADLGAAQLTGDPHGLASALKKLERMSGGNKGIFEKILRPGEKRAQPAMLRTHPPTPERVEKLMELVDHELVKQAARIQPPETPRRRIVVQQQQPRLRRKPGYHWVSGLWH